MQDIKHLRTLIDQIDDSLLDGIKKRITVMKQIGEVKKNIKKETRDEDREGEKKEHLKQKARELGIPENIITSIWQIFFEESVEIEK